MSREVTAFVLLVIFGSALCMSDVHKQCVETFTEELSNDFLHGTWYYVMKFELFGFPIPSMQCLTSILQKANSTEVERYKNEYWTEDIPYNFEDNPMEEQGELSRPAGLVIGNKQAKFVILDPATHFYRPLYDVRVYQKLTDEFVLFHDCNQRGHVMWLISRNRNPSDEEIEAIVKTRPELLRLEPQRFCSLT